MQAQAQAQAQQAAEEACHLDAAAQQLQAEAHLVAFKGSLGAPGQHEPGSLPFSSVGGASLEFVQAATQGEQISFTAGDQQMGNGLVSCSPSRSPALASLLFLPPLQLIRQMHIPVHCRACCDVDCSNSL
jgi:hypothetical protein